MRSTSPRSQMELYGCASPNYPAPGDSETMMASKGLKAFLFSKQTRPLQVTQFKRQNQA